MNVAAIDCEKQKDLCKNYEVQSVPTFKIFLEDRSKNPLSFRTAITIPNLERETITKLENHVIKVGNKNIADLRERAIKENKHIFIVYPTKKSTSPMFMSISTVRHL